jgi:hypothetical protein
MRQYNVTFTIHAHTYGKAKPEGVSSVSLRISADNKFSAMAKAWEKVSPVVTVTEPHSATAETTDKDSSSD